MAVATSGCCPRVWIETPRNRRKRGDNGKRLRAEQDGSVGATGGDLLDRQQRLETGEYLRSPNMRYTFGMSPDGNLELLKGAQPIWSADTCCADAYAIMQRNGDLVVYDGRNVRFSSVTAGNSGARLVVRNNGTAVILDTAANVIWSTRR